MILLGHIPVLFLKIYASQADEIGYFTRYTNLDFAHQFFTESGEFKDWVQANADALCEWVWPWVFVCVTVISWPKFKKGKPKTGANYRPRLWLKIFEKLLSLS